MPVAGCAAAGATLAGLVFHKETLWRPEAMKNDKARSHSINYQWNQMKITIRTKR